MELYTLIITLDVPSQPSIVRLVYRDKIRAASAERFATPTMSDAPSLERELSDDYGRHVWIRAESIIAVQLSHVNEELNAEADLATLQQHAQVAFNRRIAADPMMRGIQPANGPLPFMPRGN